MSEINLNHQDLTKCSFEEFCEEFGADSQIIKMKASLIRKIEEHCKKNKISQRKLASMVDGLTHDRVSKIFNGRVGHMTIDKLLQITQSLDIKVKISFPKTSKNTAA